MSVVSAATRGFIGEMLLGPVGLAAAVTAKRHEVHIVGIEFRDGERSVIESDSELYKLLAASCF